MQTNTGRLFGFPLEIWGMINEYADARVLDPKQDLIAPHSDVLSLPELFYKRVDAISYLFMKMPAPAVKPKSKPTLLERIRRLILDNPPFEVTSKFLTVIQRSISLLVVDCRDCTSQKMQQVQVLGVRQIRLQYSEPLTPTITQLKGDSSDSDIEDFDHFREGLRTLFRARIEVSLVRLNDPSLQNDTDQWKTIAFEYRTTAADAQTRSDKQNHAILPCLKGRKCNSPGQRPGNYA